MEGKNRAGVKGYVFRYRSRLKIAALLRELVAMIRFVLQLIQVVMGEVGFELTKPIIPRTATHLQPMNGKHRLLLYVS